MKKAKIVLSAVALFAVVGGALAFKARQGDAVFYKTTTATSVRCTLTYVNSTLIPNGAALTTTYATTIPGGLCTTLTPVFAGQ